MSKLGHVLIWKGALWATQEPLAKLELLDPRRGKPVKAFEIIVLVLQGCVCRQVALDIPTLPYASSPSRGNSLAGVPTRNWMGWRWGLARLVQHRVT